MARTYTVTNLAVPKNILEALEKKKQSEGRLGSLTAYAAEILSRFINGTMVSEELLRAKIEAELRKKILEEIQRQEPRRTAVEVKAHRPAKENTELGREAI